MQKPILSARDIEDILDQLPPEAIAALAEIGNRLKAERGDDASRSASALGRLGGRSRSAAKAAAARANGQKGGRPRKRPQTPAE